MKKRLLTGLAVIAMITSLTSTIWGAEPETDPSNQTFMVHAMPALHNDFFQNFIDSGMITQETAEQMREFYQTALENIMNEPEKGIGNLYDQMVTAGILTTDEKNNIEAYQKEEAQLRWTEFLNETLGRYQDENILDEDAAKAFDYLLNDWQETRLNTDNHVFIKAGRAIPADSADFIIDEKPNLPDGFLKEMPEDMESFSIVFENGEEPFHGEKSVAVTVRLGIDLSGLQETGIITQEQLEQMKESDENYYQGLGNHFITVEKFEEKE